MVNHELRPALVVVEKTGGVSILRLVEKEGILAIPDGVYYSWIGWVHQEPVVIDGTNAKRWFYTNSMDITSEPFTQKAASVKALLEWNGLREAHIQETSAPLF